jgi:hypothetical protein
MVAGTPKLTPFTMSRHRANIRLSAVDSGWSTASASPSALIAPASKSHSVTISSPRGMSQITI